MKFKLEKPVLIKLVLIAAILIIAPYAVPFSLEFVLMADVMGLEALALFLIYQARHVVCALRIKLTEWRSDIVTMTILLASVHIFQPRVLLSHTLGSSLLLLFTCSIGLALALWVPAIYLSVGGFS